MFISSVFWRTSHSMKHARFVWLTAKNLMSLKTVAIYYIGDAATFLQK